MGITGGVGEKHPTLSLDRQTADALATYAKMRWPVARRAGVAREFDLTDDDARAVIEGAASKRIIDLIWKHPNGGWAVVVPVLGSVIGHGLEDYLQSERDRLARERDAYAQREAHLTTLEDQLRERRSFDGPVAGQPADAGRDLGARPARLGAEASSRRGGGR